MLDLVIFDCDGVLVDSEILSADTLIHELKLIGIEIDRDYVRTHCLGRSFPTVAKSLAKNFDTVLPADFEQRYRANLLARFETELCVTDGIFDAIKATQAAGLKTCVATSSSPPRVARTLGVTGLAPLFGPNVFTASQVEHGKPAPDLFLFAAKQMGALPSRTLVIEDSLPGLEAGSAAQMHVLAYAGASHLKGLRLAQPSHVRSFDKWEDFPHLLDEFSNEDPA